MRRGLIGIFVFLNILAFSGCSGVQTIRLKELQTPKRALEVVAALPVQLLYEYEVQEDALRTHDVLSTLWTESSWPVIPPSNFTVISRTYQDPLRKTDALLRLISTQKTPRLIGVLDTTISYREAKGRSTIMQGAQTRVGQAHQLDLVISMALVGANGQTLVELETIRRIDPFAVRPDYDTRPEISVALQETAEELINLADEHVVPTQGISIHGSPTLAAVPRYGQQLAPIKSSTTLDPIQAQVRAWHIAQYLNPSQDFDSMDELHAQPAGICLNNETDDARFAEGDCILKINGKPLFSLHYLRLLLHEVEPGSVITLEVRSREGHLREVKLKRLLEG